VSEVWRTTWRVIVVAIVVTFVPVAARAEVSNRSSAGFIVTVTLSVAAPPETVYASLTRHVAEWWDAAHTYSGDSKNLSIIAEPGGCFCEALADGGGVQHAMVVNVAPGRLLRMSGALGPLQASAVTGTLSWQFEKSGSADSKLVVTYVVGGYASGGLDKIADAVDMVITRQAQLLKRHAEEARGRR
jgi:uncharacterized protein YndB with AHSA1/START domain